MTDVIEVARSREKHSDNSGLPFIDLTALEAQDGHNRLVGDIDEPKEQPKSFFNGISSKKRNSIILIVVLLLIFSALAYSDIVFRNNTIAHGISVSDVNIGGMTSANAHKTLQDSANTALSKPIVLKLNSKEVKVKSKDLNLQYNIDSTIKNAQNIDRSYNPLNLLNGLTKRYTTGKDIKPVVSYNKKHFDEVAQQIVNDLTKGRSNAGISLDGSNVTVIKPQGGNGVSIEQARQALKTSLLTFDRSPHILKEEKVNAQVTLDEAQRVKKILEIMLSQNSVLTTPAGNSITTTPEQLRSALVITANKSKLDISINEQRLRGQLTNQLTDVEVAPQDATFATSGSSVSIIPSIPGRQIDFSSALKRWIAGEHNFSVTTTEKQPAHDTTWAKKLNITEIVSSFTTNFPAGQERVKNITRAAAQTNGTVVEPGQSFSLNETLGRRTAENGYVKAPVFSAADGFFEDFGGGASQFSTTLFNAAFIGGYKDITHTPHSIYISRYPKGREATLNYGSIDMSFRNDSQSGILIRTSVGPTSVTVVLYGNKEGREVILEGPVEVSRTEPTTEYSDDPTLPVGKEKQTQPGYPGIVVDNFRTVNRPGQPGKKEHYRWTYNMIPRKVNRGTKPVDPSASTPVNGVPA